MPINRVTQKTVYDQWHDYVPPETCMLLKIPVSLQSANPFNLQGPHALSNNEDSKRRSLGPIGLYMRGCPVGDCIQTRILRMHPRDPRDRARFLCKNVGEEAREVERIRITAPQNPMNNLPIIYINLVL